MTRWHVPFEGYLTGCFYPGVEAAGMCCGGDPCDLEWYHPCDKYGGCWDRATCGDCSEPVWPGPSSDDWARAVMPRMLG